MKREETKEKAEYFLEKKQKIHIRTYSHFFFNGFIRELKSNLLILNDDKLGDTPISYGEITSIEPWMVGE